VAALFASFVSGCSDAAPLPSKSAEGTTASPQATRSSRDQPRTTTSLRVPDLDSRLVDPFGSREAAATVFLFVRTDCPIANRYAPAIRQLDEAYRSKNVAFWLVYADPDEDAGAIRKHLSDYRHKAPALRDVKHDLVRHCQATTTPEVAVFNSRRDLVYHGRIDDQYTDFGKARNAPSRHDLRDAIEAVLAGRKVNEPYLKPIGCYIAALPE